MNRLFPTEYERWLKRIISNTRHINDNFFCSKSQRNVLLLWLGVLCDEIRSYAKAYRYFRRNASKYAADLRRSIRDLIILIMWATCRSIEIRIRIVIKSHSPNTATFFVISPYTRPNEKLIFQLLRNVSRGRIIIGFFLHNDESGFNTNLSRLRNTKDGQRKWNCSSKFHKKKDMGILPYRYE